MEEPVAQEKSSGVSGNSGRPWLQKYALRSASKAKEQKPDASNLSNSSASKRVRPAASSVSKSVGVLDLSGKDKSCAAKPLRRLSIPSKAAATPGPKLSATITPISETRTRRSVNGQGRSETPISDISRSSSRTKFNMLSKPSYWLSQIKVSESSGKHSISLGFFKLALEAGCEPLKKMQDELKSYVRRHNLADLGESVKELFESYNITDAEDNIQQSQISETISQVPEDGTRSSDEEVHSSSSTVGAGTGKLKPKCLNIDSTQVSPPVKESTKKVTGQKNNAGSRVKEDAGKNSSNSKPASETSSRRSMKKSEKPSKQEAGKEKGKVMKHGKKSEAEQTTVSPSPPEVTIMGDKENVDASLTEERV
ncbi:hypothetical protein QN277_006798 [Acacia crassicarpa]|uniref:Uncharacterized protein n=1 Tax=Acacia crassicarpa TaxID=499986 RepID=A0AAE1ITI9_9FABA|nr:hypothetical protein QN277_006798 [Acacia crassicarpa]